MAGSLREFKPGIWECVSTLVVTALAESDTLHHLWGSQTRAERELARLVTAQEEKPQRPRRQEEQAWGPTTTINDAIEGWKRNGWQDLSPNTVRGYEGVWCRHVRESIGTRRIATLSPYDIEVLPRPQSGRSRATTVRLVRALLHRSCRLARKWSGNVLPNPVSDTELPSWSPTERPVPVRAPEPDEVLGILKAARSAEPRVAVLIRLVAARGCAEEKPVPPVGTTSTKRPAP